MVHFLGRQLNVFRDYYFIVNADPSLAGILKWIDRGENRKKKANVENIDNIFFVVFLK